MTAARHIVADAAAVREIYRRWASDINLKAEDSVDKEWRGRQCGACRFWIPLAGRLGYDYGACSNVLSEFDGRVRFEHDGCQAYEDAGKWLIPEDFS